MNDQFKRAQRHHDNANDEPRHPKRRTQAEQEVEGARRRFCRLCGKWKMMGDFAEMCDDCAEELS